MGGVCERFPDLRFLFLEAGGGWVPSLLERMDEQVEGVPAREALAVARCRASTSSASATRASSPRSGTSRQCAEFLGADRIIWASDYPHPEYHEGIVDELRKQLEGVAPSVAAAHPRPQRRRRLPLGPVTARPVTAPRDEFRRDRSTSRRMRRERHARLVDAVRTQHVDTLVLLGQPNVAYATGSACPRGRSDAGDAPPIRRARHRRRRQPPQLWTWFPEGAPADLPADHVHTGLDLEWDDGARRCCSRRSPTGTVAIDEYTMPLYHAMRAAGRAVVDASGVLGAAKISKTADEIECIRRAAGDQRGRDGRGARHGRAGPARAPT